MRTKKSRGVKCRSASLSNNRNPTRKRGGLSSVRLSPDKILPRMLPGGKPLDFAFFIVHYPLSIIN